MSREIKYRQAVYVGGKFNYFHYWGFIKGGFVSPETGASSIEEALKNSAQFTGLRDRNGVDIYEGDILRYKDEIASVEYCDGGYELIKGNGEFLMHIYAVLEDSFSILGNLHENADLLDSAKVTENVTGEE